MRSGVTAQEVNYFLIIIHPEVFYFFPLNNLPIFFLLINETQVVFLSIFCYLKDFPRAEKHTLTLEAPSMNFK